MAACSAYASSVHAGCRAAITCAKCCEGGGDECVCVGAGVGDGKKRGMEGLEKLNLITVFGYQIGRSRGYSTLESTGIGRSGGVCGVCVD